MAMNYQKLWALLNDRNLKKKHREMAGLTTNVIAKMGKGGDVSTEVLRKFSPSARISVSTSCSDLPRRSMWTDSPLCCGNAVSNTPPNRLNTLSCVPSN